MAVTLYRHNQSAYEAAIAMIDNTGKAAVIHPTGTGKSFIAFKFCQEHEKEKICWLAPSQHIYRTQLDNWVRAGGEEPENICFFTYARLMMMSREEMETLHPTYIVLDEFHRCGARMWGQGVERLLHCYPAAGLLGLSATNIRYLDSRRDMARELFGACIASRMSLGEAITQGILRPPKYVLSVYDWEESLAEYETKAKRLRGSAKAEAQAALEELRRALGEAKGLDAVFYEHMPDHHGRYLVFCASVEHMREMQKKAQQWFAQVDLKPRVYAVSSQDSQAGRILDAFKADDSSHLKLLYCIDMLNEGVHVEGLSGVILLRPTASPIIYKQQIGRALSAGDGGEPVIFDVVLNIRGLCSVGALEEEVRAARTAGQKHLEGTAQGLMFQVTGEAKDCIRLFANLEKALGTSWEGMFQSAKEYWRIHGNLEISRNYIDEDGRSLGAWLETQRRIYQGKAPGSLTKEQKERLTSIGMRWECAWERVWEQKFSAAKAYWQTYGNLKVPVSYISSDGIRLGKWIRRQRQEYQYASPGDTTAWERKRRLAEIGMDWEEEDSWEQKFQLAKEYYDVHGSLDMPGDTVVEGVWLARWLNGQKARMDGRFTGTDKQRKPLSSEQMQKLESLGMKKGVSRRDILWRKRYQEVKNYQKQNGHLHVPIHYPGADGRDLGLWLKKQKTKLNAGKLDEDRAALLRELGIPESKKESGSPSETCES